jgi:hypothetical protein
MLSGIAPLAVAARRKRVIPFIDPAFLSATVYVSDVWPTFEPFTGLDLSAGQLAVFIAGTNGAVNDTTGLTLTPGGDSSPGWSQLNHKETGNLSSVVGSLTVFSKANPTSNETLQLSSGVNGTWSGILYLLAGVDTLVGAFAKQAGISAGVNANPPSLDLGAAHDSLLIAAVALAAACRSKWVRTSRATAGRMPPP